MNFNPAVAESEENQSPFKRGAGNSNWTKLAELILTN